MTVARSVPGPARSACRLRFLVRHTHQNALFRKMRFSLPEQTWRCLTEKRILLPAPHGKAHSVLIDSRKGALCDSQIAQTAPFRYVAAPGKCGATPPPGCGALWRMPLRGFWWVAQARTEHKRGRRTTGLPA